jgi:8-oxo-dGTP pyrophosphatase MutT (NUDIX family)
MTHWHLVPVFGDRVADFPSTIRPSAYGIISDEKGRLAVVRTPKGFFLPGGGQDDSESAEATVIREAAEECGLMLRVGSWRSAAIEHVSSATEQAHFEKRSLFCDATALGQSSQPGEFDHELMWMPASEARAVLTPASHRWAVSEWWPTRGDGIVS